MVGCRHISTYTPLSICRAVQDYACAPIVDSSRPFASQYDPRGAYWSKQPHHERVSDRAYAERPGGWWEHVQGASTAGGEHDHGHDGDVAAMLPRAPYLPERPQTCTHGAGADDCVLHEMRYGARTVWQ